MKYIKENVMRKNFIHLVILNILILASLSSIAMPVKRSPVLQRKATRSPDRSQSVNSSQNITAFSARLFAQQGDESSEASSDFADSDDAGFESEGEGEDARNGIDFEEHDSNGAAGGGGSYYSPKRSRSGIGFATPDSQSSPYLSGGHLRFPPLRSGLRGGGKGAGQDKVAENTAEVTTLKAVGEAVLARLDMFTSNAPIAAGEESIFQDLGHRGWISGFFGSNTDKNGSKKKGSFVGGSLGYEIIFGSKDVIGVAFSSVHAKSKLTQQTVKSDNYIFSAYGLKNFDNIFVNAAIFGGFTNNNSVRKNTDGEAKGKFKGSLYGIATGAGYQIASGKHVVTPNLSLSYFAANQKGYKEKGEGAHDVNSQKMTVLNAKIAVKYGYMMEKDGINITPSVNVGLSRDLHLRAKAGGGKVVATGDGLVISNNNKRQTLFFITPAVDVKADNFDVKLAYTLEKGSKFIGHVGSIKASLKF